MAGSTCAAMACEISRSVFSLISKPTAVPCGEIPNHSSPSPCLLSMAVREIMPCFNSARLFLNSFCSVSICRIAQFLEVTLHLLFQLGQFGLELEAFGTHGHQVDFFLFLEGVHIAGDVEVEVVGFDFVKAGEMGVFIFAASSTEYADNFVDVFLGQLVLVFAGFELAAGIDKQHGVVAFVLAE